MRYLIPACALLLAGACSTAEDSGQSMERRLLLTPELRIGSIDDPETSLTWPRQLQIGRDGRIYSLHPEESSIRIHDADGRPAGVIGRPGEGPGEFQSVGTMGWVGDTLWVLDFGNYRFSYFSEDGTLLRSTAVPIDLGSSPSASPPRPNGLLADGTIFGSSPAWSREVAAGNITQSALLRLDEKSQPLDTLYSMPLVNTTWAIQDPKSGNGFGSFSAQPFSDTELLRHAPNAAEIVRVDRTVPTSAEGATFRVTRLTFGGDTVFSRDFPYDPQPIDPAVVDSLLRMQGERMAQISERMPGAPTPARAEELARESLYLPSYHPAVSSMVLGRDGSIWLKREDLGGDTSDWLVLSTQGAVIGTVATPREMRVLEAEEGRVWGVETDELDVPYIVQYAVEVEGGAT